MPTALIIAIAVVAAVVLVAVVTLLRRTPKPPEAMPPRADRPPAQAARPPAEEGSRPSPASPPSREATAPFSAEAPVPPAGAVPTVAVPSLDDAAEPTPDTAATVEMGAEDLQEELPTQEIDIEEADLGAAGVAAPAPTSSAPPKEAAARVQDVEALRKGLASTRGGFIARIAKLFGGRPEIDPELLEELQELLITADIGVATSERILEKLRERMGRQELQDEERVWAALREEARAILARPARPMSLDQTPSVVLVVGVNGVGKTTTIGKLADRLTKEGRKVLLAAGDTFRAAAVPQLEVWGRRTDCEVVKGKHRADPSSVIFEAIKRAQDEGVDVVIADTAGRLQTKTNLMEELKKVHRTGEKALGRPIDEVLLVLDSTTGQNAVQQAQLFKEAIPVNGVVLTKLDGTAKGGVILRIVDEHDLPVQFVGVGERVEDLREFDASTFVEALFAKPDGEAQAA
ncbi:MAG: signal recognition particle-docking protein FtsY [Sandaracinaceae bacterium]